MAGYGTDTRVRKPLFIQVGPDGIPSGMVRVEIDDKNHIVGITIIISLRQSFFWWLSLDSE